MRRAGSPVEAAKSYERALALVTNDSERRFRSAAARSAVTGRVGFLQSVRKRPKKPGGRSEDGVRRVGSQKDKSPRNHSHKLLRWMDVEKAAPVTAALPRLACDYFLRCNDIRRLGGSIDSRVVWPEIPALGCAVADIAFRRLRRPRQCRVVPSEAVDKLKWLFSWLRQMWQCLVLFFARCSDSMPRERCRCGAMLATPCAKRLRHVCLRCSAFSF